MEQYECMGNFQHDGDVPDDTEIKKMLRRAIWKAARPAVRCGFTFNLPRPDETRPSVIRFIGGWPTVGRVGHRKYLSFPDGTCIDAEIVPMLSAAQQLGPDEWSIGTLELAGHRWTIAMVDGILINDGETSAWRADDERNVIAISNRIIDDEDPSHAAASALGTAIEVAVGVKLQAFEEKTEWAGEADNNQE
jgi:hypothetical protein